MITEATSALPSKSSSSTLRFTAALKGSCSAAVVGTNPILSLLQRRKLRKLIRVLKEEQGFTHLGGHRDVVATECPGDRIYGWVRKWRDDFNLRRP